MDEGSFRGSLWALWAEWVNSYSFTLSLGTWKLGHCTCLGRYCESIYVICYISIKKKKTTQNKTMVVKAFSCYIQSYILKICLILPHQWPKWFGPEPCERVVQCGSIATDSLFSTFVQLIWVGVKQGDEWQSYTVCLKPTFKPTSNRVPKYRFRKGGLKKWEQINNF